MLFVILAPLVLGGLFLLMLRVRRSAAPTLGWIHAARWVRTDEVVTDPFARVAIRHVIKYPMQEPSNNQVSGSYTDARRQPASHAGQNHGGERLRRVVVPGCEDDLIFFLQHHSEHRDLHDERRRDGAYPAHDV